VVGGEVEVVGDEVDAVRWGGAQGGHGELEEVHRGGVGDRHLVGPGADQASDLAPHPQRRLDPAVDVPAADQVLAPFARADVGQPRQGRLRRRAQRIAVEVDHAFRQVEGIAELRQRVDGV